MNRELRFTLEDKESIEKVFFYPKDRVTYDIIDDRGIEYKHLYIKKSLLTAIKERASKLNIELKIKQNKEPGIMRNKKVFGVPIFPYKTNDTKGERVIRVKITAPINKLYEYKEKLFEGLDKLGIKYTDCVWG